MYAIVETGGKQYRVKPGDMIAVERIAGEPGEVLDLGRVLLVADNGSDTRVGAPGVEGAVVRAEVVEHARGEKVIVFRYKSKVRYRRKTGHRQALTRLRITDILLDGSSSARAEAPREEEPEKTEAPRRRRAAPAAEATQSAPAAEVTEPAPVAEATQSAPPAEATRSAPTEAEETVETESEA